MSRLTITALTIALLAIPMAGGSALGATPTCRGLEATMVGTNKAELMRGTPGRDVIVAKDGNDWVLAQGGNDVICGGPGRDMLNGEGGADKIFGNRGNDKLKGGAGFDRLVGGKGTDACYSGADGATQITCEGADLRVSISAPSSAAEGATIKYTVTVRNIGPKPSSSFHLVIDEQPIGVDCGADLSLDDAFPSLVPGGFAIWTNNHISGCDITGADPRLRIEAQVNQPGSDADPSNDDDSARVDITGP